MSPATVARYTCDGWISRVVLGPDGAVLNLGRRARLFSAEQKRAMAVRDRGCVWPGCGRPPGWCDAHHLDPYDHGGPTDLDNGALLCRRHHTLVHEGGWRLHRDGRGAWVARAP